MRAIRARSGAMAALAAVLLLGGTAATRAQAPDSPLAAATSAFGALPEAERKAIQVDLIWTGHLNSAATGSFGPLTFRAINAFKAGRGAADGRLAPAERQELARAAQAARQATGFAVLTDERTGVRIGIPARLLPKREALPNGGSRWQSADGRVTLDVSATPPGDTLKALFERATAANPNAPRKITYKLLRPDFFVVAGETATGKFFRRQAFGEAGLRGFSIGYDKALAGTLDRVVTAIADSFEPFPGPGAPAGAQPRLTGQGPAAAMMAVPGGPVARHPAGIALGGGRVAVALATLKSCPAPRIAGKPATIAARDEAAGLAVIESAEARKGAGPALRAGRPDAGERLVALAYADADGRAVASAIPAEALAGEGTTAIRAALQPGQAGAAVFDMAGRLVGLAIDAPPETGLVAGVAPARDYRLAGPAAIAALGGGAAAATPEAGPSSTGAVVAVGLGLLVPMGCGA